MKSLSDSILSNLELLTTSVLQYTFAILQKNTTYDYEKYNEKAYDEIKVRVKKGNKKIIQDYAKAKDETVNQLINRLLESEIPTIE